MGAAALPPGARLTAAAAMPFHPDTVALDVDGVLVDVEPSFREAVRHTVAALQRLMGVERPWTPSHAEIAQLKRAGGFNDDIHSSIALAAVGAGGAAGRLEALLSAVEAAGGGLAGLRAAAPELPRVDGGLCVRVFDEHYWGADRFRAVFGEDPRHVTTAAGLVDAERPLVAADLPRRLRETAQVARVALITGRTPPELEAALELLGWSLADVDAVVTGDQLRKPDPACLERVLDACGSSAAVYAGDVRDDWELVRRHRAERPGGPPVRGVIVGGEAEALRPLGVDVTLREAGDLVPLLRWWAAA
ncbi:MAG TPA: HAD family hydrolase [Candidatus Dormibacteraeota bacterium]